MKKLFILPILLLSVCQFSVFSEESIPIDTFFTRNIMIATVIYTNRGIILNYYIDNKPRETYLPNAFFINGKAKQVIDEDRSTTPQANVIFKNGKAFKIKLYVPKNAFGGRYKVIDVLSEEQKEKFKTEELIFEW
ncbi:MAG TPA: hypothetical protein PK385_03640 [Spirochaetota bacterium]|nr:hypothetical protein [Spirochaetota bacterium]HOS33517.1 hypothetical protein [Spirochaetota bacterium]HOS55131.1 hypothetical protein [Spirochaetota bacterium]HPK63055.1 hypothetical protein [Spirochaetota bacterium]HQF77638.1 hypothetical protein [Spirochaetota bacterium]